MNFNIILTILGIASMMNLVHKAPIYYKILDKLLLDTKPFNCVMCSTFWVTLVVSAPLWGLQSILIAAITAIIAELINIQIHKI
jgi:hypothetical protein